MNSTKKYWDYIKKKLEDSDVMSYEDTRSVLIKDNYYLRFIGKAKNRTMISENASLYVSIMKHTEELENVFRSQKTYKTSWDFSHRMRFIVELDRNIELLRCKCGKKYTWTEYCRMCPDYKRGQLGKPHTDETKRKMRISTLSYLKQLHGVLGPRYNKNSISIIEKYGKENNLSFMHAENGGEYFVKELGYFLDGYDPINKVAIEIDESHHFDNNGNLKERDVIRENEIKKLLNCKFIRIKYDKI